MSELLTPENINIEKFSLIFLSMMILKNPVYGFLLLQMFIQKVKKSGFRVLFLEWT